MFLIIFLHLAKFAAVTPQQSILLSCKLSFPIVVLKICSVPNTALQSPDKNDVVPYMTSLTNSILLNADFNL